MPFVKGVTLGDIYAEVKAMEEAMDRMFNDIESADCDSETRCLLEDELAKIDDKYGDLMNSSIEFSRLNFPSVVEAINECMACIDIGQGIDLFPHSFANSSRCKSNGKKILLEDIARVRVYEHTGSNTRPDIYVGNRNAFPFVFTTNDNEQYVVNWDAYRDGISVKVFNKTPGGNVNGFFNVAKVVVELTEGAQKEYKTKEVTACRVDIVTAPVSFSSSRPLRNAIDGSERTSPRMTANHDVVEGVFQFVV